MSGRWEVERAVLASALPSAARHVALTLLTFADAATAVIPEKFSPSLTGLARCTGLGRSTVARELNRLEEEKWIIRDRPDPRRARREGAPTQYRLRAPGSPGAGLVPERDYPGSPRAGLAVVPQRDSGSPAAGHNQNRAKPPSEQKKPARADAYSLPGFAEFWDTYPRKIAKRSAATAYRSALNRCGDAQLIIKGASRYRDDPGRADAFTKHPATWLNGDCWADEPEPHRSATDQRVARAQALKAQLRTGTNGATP